MLDSDLEAEAPHRHRPRFVTWLTVGVLILAAAYLTRFGASLSAPDLGLAVPRAYLSGTGAVWGALGLGLGYGLWSGRRWAPLLLRAAGLTFLAWYWVDRLALVQSEFSRHTRLWAAAATVLVLAVVVWGIRRPDVRRFFQESQA
jgi:hypothetical protein